MIIEITIKNGYHWFFFVLMALNILYHFKGSNNFIRFKNRRNKKTPKLVQSWHHQKTVINRQAFSRHLNRDFGSTILVLLVAVIYTLDCNLPSRLEKLVTFSFPTFITKNRLPLYVDICPHHPSSVFPAEEV